MKLTLRVFFLAKKQIGMSCFTKQKQGGKTFGLREKKRRKKDAIFCCQDATKSRARDKSPFEKKKKVKVIKD